jgi:PII-like signaling protein
MIHAEITQPTAALRLTIFIGDGDRWHHKPLSTEIVHRAHAQGLAGASVFHGSEGYGASSIVHTSRLLSMSEDLPLAIVIVDLADKIRAFLPQLDELITQGLVTLDDVSVIKYPGRKSSDSRH